MASPVICVLTTPPHYCCFLTTCWYLLVQPHVCGCWGDNKELLFLPETPQAGDVLAVGLSPGVSGFEPRDVWPKLSSAGVSLQGQPRYKREHCIPSFRSNLPLIKINKRETKLFPQLGWCPYNFSLPFHVVILVGSSRSTEVEEGTFSLPENQLGFRRNIYSECGSLWRNRSCPSLNCRGYV